MIRLRTTAPASWLMPIAAAALLFSICVAIAAAQSFALKDGETVVFYGDSITAQRLYTVDVEDFVLTRYPALHIRFVNAGVPGDTAAGGYAGAMPERVARDVAPFEPGMITVMLGMNDGGYGYGSPAQIELDFQSRYLALLQALRKAAPDAVLTLICPTPYDEITHGTEFPGYSHMVDRLSDDVPHIASQLKSSGVDSLIVDFHRPIVDALRRAEANQPQLAPLLIPDRIHPSPASHWIMAAALMSAWHANPVVSSAELNAAQSKVTATERTTITDLQASADGLEWTQFDEALPLPLDLNNAMIGEMLRISDFAAIDRQMLRVAALPPGRYELSIDGKPVAAFTRGELNTGINLALYKTPMLNQARDIAGIEDQRAVLDHARFILSADVKPMSSSGIAEATLRAAQDQLDASMRKQLSPTPHRFTLRRIQPAASASGAHP
jgi:lysophospholipase L1-like esterase